MDNYTSATAENVRAQVETQILAEIQNGRYRIVDKKPPIVSALGAIPKKDPNKVRLIHDASRPEGQALNDYATTDHFQYQSIQDAVDLVTPNCFFAKLDLANADRSVKIHPSNYKPRVWSGALKMTNTILILSMSDFHLEQPDRRKYLMQLLKQLGL